VDFRLSSEGYQLDSSIKAAISQFPTPTTRTELRAFMGLVNQLASGTSAIAGLMALFCPLLSTKNEFLWTAEHDQAIMKVKEYFATAPVLAFLTSQSLHGYVQIQVGKAWGLYCRNREWMVHGTWYKLDHAI